MSTIQWEALLSLELFKKLIEKIVKQGENKSSDEHHPHHSIAFRFYELAFRQEFLFRVFHKKRLHPEFPPEQFPVIRESCFTHRNIEIIFLIRKKFTAGRADVGAGLAVFHVTRVNEPFLPLSKTGRAIRIGVNDLQLLGEFADVGFYDLEFHEKFSVMVAHAEHLAVKHNRIILSDEFLTKRFRVRAIAGRYIFSRKQ